MKTHVDTLDRFDMSLMVRLQQLATQHDFVVFEDRKFADIGNTVKSQLSGSFDCRVKGKFYTEKKSSSSFNCPVFKIAMLKLEKLKVLTVMKCSFKFCVLFVYYVVTFCQN